MNEHTPSGHRIAAAAVLSLFIFELMLSMKQGTFLTSTYVIAYATILARMAQWQTESDAVVTQRQPVQNPVLLHPNLMR